MADSPPDADGGKGEDTLPSRSDLALYRTAARRRWGVPDPAMTEAIYQSWKILKECEDDRLRLAAVKALTAFAKADQADDRLDLDRARFDHAKRARADLDKPPAPIDPAVAAAMIAAGLQAQGHDPAAQADSGPF